VAFWIGPRGYAYAHTSEFIKMIQGSPSDAIAPMAHRVLVPFLLKIIPLEPKSGFLLVTCVATLLTMLGMFVLLRELKISFRPSLLATQFAGFSYPIALYLAYWGMVDPVANFFEVLLLLGLVWRRCVLASMAICLGCLTKESNLLLLPLFAWWFREASQWGWSSRIRYVLLLLAPVVVTVLLRLLIHAQVDTTMGYARGWGDFPRLWKIWAENIRSMGVLVFLAAVFLRSYGFNWITAALGFRHQREWKGVCVYVLLAGVALCVVGADRSRMLGFGFMGIFIPTAFFLEHLETRRHAASYLVTLTALTVLQCAITLAAILPIGVRPWPPPLARLHQIATVGCFLAGALTAVSGYRSAAAGRVPEHSA
jgi:hypothetical protein